MEKSLSTLLEAEVGAVLPARQTLAVISFASLSSRISAGSLAVTIVNKAAGNQVANAAGATVWVSQSVSQGVSV